MSALKSGSPALMIQPTLHEIVIDWTNTAGLAAGVVTTVTQLFQCPEDFVVLSAGYEILALGTATATLDLGKAGGTELLSAIALDAAIGTKGQGAMAAPVFFQDSDTIDCQVNTASCIIGKIRLWWVGIDVSETHTVADI